MGNFVFCCFNNLNFYVYFGRMYILYYFGEKIEIVERYFKNVVFICEKEFNFISKEGKGLFEE